MDLAKAIEWPQKIPLDHKAFTEMVLAIPQHQ